MSSVYFCVAAGIYVICQKYDRVCGTDAMQRICSDFVVGRQKAVCVYWSSTPFGGLVLFGDIFHRM